MKNGISLKQGFAIGASLVFSPCLLSSYVEAEIFDREAALYRAYYSTAVRVLRQLTERSDAGVERRYRLVTERSLAQAPDRRLEPVTPALPRPSPVAPSFAVVAAFDWEMKPRFVDQDGNRIPDLPNSFEFVHNLPSGECTRVDCSKVIPEFDIAFEGSTRVLRILGEDLVAPSFVPYYRWKIVSLDGRTVASSEFRPVPNWNARLPEGAYDVSVTVGRARAVTEAGAPSDVEPVGTNTRRIRLEDILIVSIGDSFSSGEGNPERLRGGWRRGPHGEDLAQWADDGSGNTMSRINMRHAKAHRSTLSWPAQAALAIEQADSRSSVTFVSVATTGATIHRGLLAPSRGVSHEHDPPDGLPAQLDEVKAVVGSRQIDILLVSVGINDIGFANILQGFLLAGESASTIRDYGGTNDFSNHEPWRQRLAVVAASQTGDWTQVLRANPDSQCNTCPQPTGLNSLRGGYVQLGRELRSRFPGQISDVYVLGYPDPTTKRVGNSVAQCQEILNDMIGGARTGTLGHIITTIFGSPAPDLEIGRREQRDLINLILEPLNANIKGGAEDNGWSFVLPSFDGHGYCAAYPVLRPGEAYYFALGNPYPNPVPPSSTGSSWFRTAGQSVVVQGPLSVEGVCGAYCVSTATETYGTMHPNELGHQAAKQALLSRVVLPVDVPGIGLVDTDNSFARATSFVGPLVRDWVAPASDVDVFRVDSTALPLLTEAAASGPYELDITPSTRGREQISIEVHIEGEWHPTLRLYDKSGTLITESSTLLGGQLRLLYPVATRDLSNFYVAISSNEKREFDLFTGTGVGGGRGGAYSLKIVKMLQRIAPIIPDSSR